MPKKEPSLSISIRGDQNYKRAVTAVANDNKVKVADIVRKALDAHFGKEIEEYLIFFNRSGKNDCQSEKMIASREQSA